MLLYRLRSPPPPSVGKDGREFRVARDWFRPSFASLGYSFHTFIPVSLWWTLGGENDGRYLIPKSISLPYRGRKVVLLQKDYLDFQSLDVDFGKGIRPRARI